MPEGFAGTVVLAQTDTTAGLLSRDGKRLNGVKGRRENQPLIRAVGDLKTLKSFARVPQDHKNRVRRMNKTTFVFKNGESCRVIRGGHARFFERIGWSYTTSANPTGQAFDETWAKAKADLWVLTPQGLGEKPASKLVKLGKTRLKKLR